MSRPFGTNQFDRLSVKKMLQFNELVAQLKVCFTLLPDIRTGYNTSYTIQDAALSAFSIFFTQCPSFLANQTKMQEMQGENNASSLFQVTNIPTDNHIRNLLDPVAPSQLTPLFELVFKNLLAGGFIEPYRNINNTVLIALDGVCYHSSSAISCDTCRTQKHKNGQTTYTHTAITPVIVAPGNPHVVSLPPEFMTPQDGHEKQDSEHAAAKRWLKQHASVYRDLGVTFLGDDLYACQSICQAMLDEQCHFLLTCKPDSHKTLYEWVTELDIIGKVSTVIVNRRHGKKHYIDTYRYINEVPLRDSDDALMVNWCELITLNEKGDVLYRNSFITNHLISKDNIIDMVSAARARWKIENENNNTLKTKGYNLEHNFGHGTQYLSQLLLAMNLLAFLYHTVLHFVDTAYQLIRARLPTRKTFFDDFRALTRYIYFDNWQTLMQFMMKGLKIKFPETS